MKRTSCGRCWKLEGALGSDKVVRTKHMFRIAARDVPHQMTCVETRLCCFGEPVYAQCFGDLGG